MADETAVDRVRRFLDVWSGDPGETGVIATALPGNVAEPSVDLRLVDLEVLVQTLELLRAVGRTP